MPSPQSLAHPSIDFVSSDFEALASHMRHCASARSRWFSLGSHLQQLRSVAAGRLVTMACAAVMLGIGLSAIV